MTDDKIDPTVEDAYWRTSYASRPYITDGATYDDYGPAYRYGVDSYVRRDGRTFEQAEPEMMSAWQQSKGLSRLRWEDAVFATRDSWKRLDDSVER